MIQLQLPAVFKYIEFSGITVDSISFVTISITWVATLGSHVHIHSCISHFHTYNRLLVCSPFPLHCCKNIPFPLDSNGKCSPEEQKGALGYPINWSCSDNTFRVVKEEEIDFCKWNQMATENDSFKTISPFCLTLIFSTCASSLSGGQRGIET